MYDMITSVLNYPVLMALGVIYAVLNVWRLKNPTWSIRAPITIRIIKIGSGVMVVFHYLILMRGFTGNNLDVAIALSRMVIFMLLLGDICTHAWVIYRIKTKQVGLHG